MENTFKEVEKKLIDNQVEIQAPAVEETAAHQIERVEKGHFRKGTSGNPSGKPKGASTKKTERLKMLMDSALEKGWPRYLTELNKLQGIDYVQEYMRMAEFRVPKQMRVDSTQVNVNLDKEQAPEYFEIGGRKFLLR